MTRTDGRTPREQGAKNEQTTESLASLRRNAATAEVATRRGDGVPSIVDDEDFLVVVAAVVVGLHWPHLSSLMSLVPDLLQKYCYNSVLI